MTKNAAIGSAAAAAAACLALSSSGAAAAFAPPRNSGVGISAAPPSPRRRFAAAALFAEKESSSAAKGGDATERTISAAPLPSESESVIDLDARAEAERATASASSPDSAATNTVNERLMAELAAAQEGTKRGPRSKLGKKIGAAFRSERTDEERQRSIEEARNLNGVNPLVALGGSVFALGMAALLWSATGYLGDLFLRNPVDTDVYTVTRLAAVFRNVVMGLFSLASGFAGVTGLGLLLLGVRVAYGVATGELDPTPIKKGRGEEVVLPNVWDLMMNKRPDRRGRRGGKSDNNPFGL